MTSSTDKRMSLAPWIIISVVGFVGAVALLVTLITGNVADAERSRAAVAGAQAQAQIERSVQEQQTAREAARLRAENTARAIDVMSILALPVLAIVAGLLVGGGMVLVIEWAAARRHERLMVELEWQRQAQIMAQQVPQIVPSARLALPGRRVEVMTSDGREWDEARLVK